MTYQAKTQPTTAFNEEISYLKLFPKTTFSNIQGDDAYSKYGPARFFMELMKLAKYGEGDNELALAKRREDLGTLLLNSAHLEEEELYVKKVVALLETKVPAGAWPLIGSGSGVYYSPLNRPLRKLDMGLRCYETSLQKLTPDFTSWKVLGHKPASTWTYNELGLTKEIVAQLVKYEFGLPAQTPVRLNWFERTTGLTRIEVEQLLYNSMRLDDLQDEVLKKLFINSGGTKRSPMKIVSAKDGCAVIEHLDEFRLNQIRFFLMLSRSTGWDFATLNEVLKLLNIKSFKAAIGSKEIEVKLRKLAQISLITRILEIAPAQALVEYSPGNQLRLADPNELPSPWGNGMNVELAHYYAQVFESGQPSNSEHTDQSHLNHLLPLLAKLGISIADLNVVLSTRIPSELDLNVVFDLVLLHHQLSDIDLELHQFISLLDTSKVAELYNTTIDGKPAFDVWHSKVETEVNSFRKNFAASASNEDVEEQVFLLWTHSYAVFAGLSESIAQLLLEGLAHQVKQGAEKSLYSDINKLIVKSTTTTNSRDTARNFLGSVHPYIQLLEAGASDEPSLTFAGHHLINYLRSKKKVQPFGQATAQYLLRFNHAYWFVAEDKRGRFLQYLHPHGASGYSLDKLTGWDLKQIEALRASFKVELDSTAKKVDFIDQAIYCFNIAHTTGIKVATLVDVNAVAASSTAYSDAKQVAARFPFPTGDATDPIQKRAKKNYALSNGLFHEELRNVLVPIVLRTLNHRYSDIDSPNHLSDYLLIDVSVNHELSISPLREAINAVQTFLVRNKHGLENHRIDHISDEMWDWIPHFRVWQASRKIESFPQNYLQSDVRRDATGLFNEFASALRQGNSTNDQVNDAFKAYLAGWDNLNHLEVVDGACYEVWDQYRKHNTPTLFLFARSNREQNTFFYTSCVHRAGKEDPKELKWKPWVEISTKIPSDTVSGVYFNHRLHLFWTELTSITDQADWKKGGTAGSDQFTLRSCRVMGIFQQMDGSWSAPAEMDSFPFSLTNVSAQSPLYWNIADTKLKAQFDPTHISWKKPLIAAFTHEGQQYLNLSCGPLLGYTHSDEAIPTYSYLRGTDLTNSNLVRFQQHINHSFAKAEKAKAGAFSSIKLERNGSANGVTTDYQFYFSVRPRRTGSSTFFCLGGTVDAAGAFSSAPALFKSDRRDTGYVNAQVDCKTLAGVVPGTMLHFAATEAAGPDRFFLVGLHEGMIVSSELSQNGEDTWKLGPREIVDGQKGNCGTGTVNCVATDYDGTETPFCHHLAYTNSEGNAVVQVVRCRNTSWLTVTHVGPSRGVSIGAHLRNVIQLQTGRLLGLVGKPGKPQDAALVLLSYNERDMTLDKIDDHDIALDPAKFAYVEAIRAVVFQDCNNDLHVRRLTANWHFGELVAMEYDKPLTFYTDYSSGVWTKSGQQTISTAVSIKRAYGDFFHIPALVSTILNTRLRRVPYFKNADEPYVIAAQYVGGAPVVPVYEGKNLSNATSKNFLVENNRHHVPPGQQVQPGTGNANKLFDHSFDAKQLTFLPIRNLPSAFYFSYGENHFLMAHNIGHVHMVQNKLNVPESAAITLCALVTRSDSSATQKYFSERITTNAIRHLNRSFFGGGIDEMLSRESQEASAKLTPSFNDLKPIAARVFKRSTDTDSNEQVDFTGPSGIYAQELFFHAPMLVADVQKQQLNSENAGRWYRYIFNPIGIDNQHLKDAWNYLPFFVEQQEGVKGIIDPDDLAEANLSIYMRWVVSSYIRNILAWGDNEFKQEEWETLNAAVQLYMEAQDLLGNRPEIQDEIAALNKKGVRTYNTIKAQQTDGFFGLPTDLQLQTLWDTLEDRLFKIRNGLNFYGQRFTPSAYGAPIDPRVLLAATRASGRLPSNPSRLSGLATNYRFRELVGATQGIIDLVVQFGGALLSALQQKDAHALETLQLTNRVTLQHFVLKVHESELERSEKNLEVIDAERVTLIGQQEHFERLIRGEYSARELDQLHKLGSAMAAETLGGTLTTVGGMLDTLPNIFGTSNGGIRWGSVATSLGQAARTEASLDGTRSQVSGIHASFERRANDWQYQLDQIKKQLDTIDLRRESEEIQHTIAKTNLNQLKRSIEFDKEILTFHQTRFTGQQLYNWMVGQMSSLYATAYHLGMASLHKLQQAYQHELISKENFIPSNSWSSLHKGLLAGETLKLALQQMQNSYLEKNKRIIEVVKTVSIKHTEGIKPASDNGDKFTWSNLLEGKEFTLKGLLGEDGNKRVQSIAITIPSVLGPYQTFGVRFSETTTNQSIEISRGLNDRGIFESEAHDGRYLPFEGVDPTEARWKCTGLGEFEDKISDFVLELNYTVR